MFCKYKSLSNLGVCIGDALTFFNGRGDCTDYRKEEFKHDCKDDFDPSWGDDGLAYKVCPECGKCSK